jgi:L-cysteine desulfidase
MADLSIPDKNVLLELNNRSQFEDEVTSLKQQIVSTLIKFVSAIQTMNIDQLTYAKIVVNYRMQDKSLEPIFGKYMIQQLEDRIRILNELKEGK